MGVEEIVNGAKIEVKLERKTAIFEEGRKLTADDLKTPQDPEEFTKGYIIEKVFSMLDVGYEAGERHFRTTDGTRKVDYEARSKDFKFIVEAKAINDDLYRSRDGAVEQIKGLFRLAEVKDNYSFGVATDGFKWIFINPDGEEIGNFSLREDFSKIKGFITGRRDARIEKKQAEISKRFYQWYNALLHGGSYRDLKGKHRKIPQGSCLIESVLNVPGEGDREEIAQVFINRLIFIKFLQGKGLIREDVLGHLTSLSQDVLDLKLRQLFFSILNTKMDKRANPDPKFAGIPYLNGSLFTWSKPEAKNPEYRINAEVLHEVIKFLDTFRFVSEIKTAEESIDPEILGYIFERAMTATDRKGTGAYYTPKYITRYICENTIYPYILGMSREYLKREKGYKDSELPSDFNDILDLRSLTLRDIYSEIVQKTTVCDPACGSGAFLLASADILFDIYTKIEDSLGREGRNPDVTLKKAILRDSIYGVDINSKGIEIAKLSLWLWVAESYDPEGIVEALPNLEYNVRAGNSLVGYVDVGKFKEAKVSMDEYLGIETPVMEHIKNRDELLREYKLSTGEEARELKKQIEEVSTKIKQRLDIHLFQDMKGKKIDISPTDFTKLDAFHWGYEFHKVFENGEGGFSVVIGNPPYVRQEALGDLKKILKEYYEVYRGVADLYTYFFERGHKILCENGQFGFISSNKFLHAAYGDALKAFLSRTAHLRTIPDFGDLPVFEDATTYPAIFLTEKTDQRGPTCYAKIPSLDFESLPKAIEKYGFEIPPGQMEGADWKLMNPKEQSMIDKIRGISISLGEYVNGEINRGITTGLNKAFVIDSETKSKLIIEDKKSKEIIKPVIEGNDIRRYEIEPKNLFIIFTRRGIDINAYPAIKKHLEQYRVELEPKKKREDKVGRKPGGYHWFEIQDSTEYFADFEKPKIVLPDISIDCRFTYDPNNHFLTNTGYIIPTDNLYILPILDSKVTRFFYQKISATYRGGYMRFIRQYLVQIPIRHISFTTPEDERARLISELKELYAEPNFLEILSRVESCLPKDAEGNFVTEKEKSDIIHDFLGFLAEQMMDLNKQKQAETKSFHAWLENYLGIKIDEMDVKTQVKAFYDRSWDEYYKVLKRSKGKLELKIEGQDAHDTIKEAFDGTMSKLTPLFGGIRGTDALIDNIVYRLYGLTEEEIKVVEAH